MAACMFIRDRPFQESWRIRLLLAILNCLVVPLVLKPTLDYTLQCRVTRPESLLLEVRVFASFFLFQIRSVWNLPAVVDIFKGRCFTSLFVYNSSSTQYDMEVTQDLAVNPLGTYVCKYTARVAMDSTGNNIVVADGENTILP
jgi:hypothetical protein